MREQSRQAKVIDLVEEEQRAVRRALNKDGTPDMRYLANRVPPAMPVGDVPMMMKEEPLEEMPAFTEPPMLSANIRLTKKGTPDRRFRQGGSAMMMMGQATAPPVIGIGATYAGGAPARQQGLRMGMDGRLSGAVFDSQVLPDAAGDQTVFLG
jgi:hypothetical protein